MKFIFNDSFSTDPNLFLPKTDEGSVFVSGNLIIEKSSIAITGRVKSLIVKYKGLDKEGKRKLAEEITNRTGDGSGLSDDDAEDFFDGISGSSSSSRGGDVSGDSMTRRYLDTIVSGSDEMGEAADAFATKATLRSRLVDQLKPFLSSDEIGKLFDDFIFKIKLPESETLDFISNIIDFASDAGANIKQLISFATMHYATRRDKGLTILLLELGGKLQKKYPEVNFFEMMIDSANGGKPKLGKLAIINDKEDMDIAKKLFSLSQHRIVEQNEALNRERKEVRDALQSMQERTNLQRAIFDAMKMNEVERALTIEIEKFGETFRRLITNPQFRALKDLQYTILAGRRLLDTWMSLYIDKQPVTPSRSTQEVRDDPKGVSRFTGEQQGRSNRDWPSRGPILVSNNSTKFIKVAQQKTNQPSQQQKAAEEKQAIDLQKMILSDLIKKTERLVIPKIRNSNIPTEAKNIVLSYINNLLLEFSKALRVNTRVSFLDMHRAAHGKLAANLSEETRVKKSNTSNSRFVISQQAGAQTSRPAVQPQFSQFSTIIDTLIGALAVLGNIETFTRIFSTGDIRDIIALYRMLSVYNQNVYMELDNQLGNVGSLAPSDSSMFSGGALTPSGAQIAVNETEADALQKLFKEEFSATQRLDAKIKADEATLAQAENNLAIESSQSVQLSVGKEAPEGDKPALEFPAELKQKQEEFVKQADAVIKNLYILLGIRRNMKKRAEVEGSDPIIMSTLRRLEQDILIRIKKHEDTREKYKSTSTILVELERSRRLRQLLRPVEKQIQLFAEAGISIASLITQPNGILNVVRRIRDEEEKALDKLIDRYTELKEKITPVNLDGFARPSVTTQTGAVDIGEPLEPTSEMI